MEKLEIMLDTQVKGDMSSFIEIAGEVLYPLYAHVKEDDQEMHVEFQSKNFIHNDTFNFWVAFDKDGKFVNGSSSLLNETVDNEEMDLDNYIRSLKSNIDKINKVHEALSKIKKVKN